MSLVLYRRYRPQTFAEVIGQEHVVQTLGNAVATEGMLSHAYLFSGPRGSGKTTLARLLAKAVNCQNRTAGKSEPCNRCSSCAEINQGRAIDLVEIDAASNRGIDEIRELRDGIKFAPAKLKYKVFIIDESHQLTKEAANALLKTLEEPPSHTIFVLATTEIQKMISTIISRCQRFDFRKLTIPEIIKQLEAICQKERVKIEKSALELIAASSQGSLRDAISMLDQAITFCTDKGDKEIELKELKEILGFVETKVVSQFVDYLKAKDARGAVQHLNAIYEKSTDLEVFAKALIGYLRQLLVLKIGAQIADYATVTLTQEEMTVMQKQAEAFKEAELQNVLRIFLEAQNKMKYSPIPQLSLELAVVSLLPAEEK